MEVNKSDFRDISVLIAGCGSIGKRHARILAALGVKNICACDPVKEQMETLINETPKVSPCTSFEDGLNQKPDAVFILSPTKLHIPMAMEAIKAGCHVFLEKPISDTSAGVNELADAADDAGKKVMVGFCFRYHKGLLKAKKMLNSGRIGRLITIRALMGEHFPAVRPDYKTLYYAKYSGAFELVHDLDLAIWFADRKVKNAYGVFGAFSDIGIDAPDTVEMLVEFEDRCTAAVHLDFFQLPRRRVMELIGTEGVITVKFASWDEYTLSVFNTESKVWESFTEKTTRDDMFMDEDKEFLQAIAKNKPILCNIEEACKSLQVVESIQNRAFGDFIPRIF